MSVGIIAVLTGMLSTATLRAREAARKAYCNEAMRQTCLSARIYFDYFDAFPPFSLTFPPDVPRQPNHYWIGRSKLWGRGAYYEVTCSKHGAWRVEGTGAPTRRP